MQRVIIAKTSGEKTRTGPGWKELNEQVELAVNAGLRISSVYLRGDIPKKKELRLRLVAEAVKLIDGEITEGIEEIDRVEEILKKLDAEMTTSAGGIHIAESDIIEWVQAKVRLRDSQRNYSEREMIDEEKDRIRRIQELIIRRVQSLEKAVVKELPEA